MKKFSFSIHGNKYDVDVKNIEDNIAEVEVNGTKYEVQLLKEFKMAKTPKLVRTTAIPTSNTDRARTSSPTEKKGAGIIKAPLPGTILEIKVKNGDTVRRGDTVLIMEAMKMENNIKTDTDGTVSLLKVNIGDAVLEGDVLVEIGA